MQWEGIWSCARGDLIVATERGEEDPFLWEHGERVARSARHIMKIPQLRTADLDREAVVVGSLYHDAAWASRVTRGDACRHDILLRPVPDDHREESASIMKRSLAKLLPPEVLRRASVAIRAMDDRETDLLEAQVLADSDRLDEFGMLSHWASVRRSTLDGKGVQSAIETWQRRKEYRFWEARLKDSFRFAQVRSVARSRLAQLEHLMEELARQHDGKDLAQACAGRADD